MPDENEIDDIEEITRDETIEEDDELEAEADEIEPEIIDEVDALAVEGVPKDVVTYSPKKLLKRVAKKAKSKSKPKVKLAPRKKPVVKKIMKKAKPKKIAKKIQVKQVKLIKKVSKVKAKAKHKNHKKRGPKGVQWTKWRIPYQENSTSGQLFRLASSKKGVSLKEFKKVCKSTGANPVVMLKALRSGKCRGWVWNVDDAHDRIRITNYHIVSKKGKSWWKGD